MGMSRMSILITGFKITRLQFSRGGGLSESTDGFLVFFFEYRLTNSFYHFLFADESVIVRFFVSTFKFINNFKTNMV